MLSKNELDMVQQNLGKALDIVRNYRKLSLTDLGEDEGFEDFADGICGDIYDAFESLEDAIGGVREIYEDME